MATNKTRLFYADIDSGNPHSVLMVTEFDIYQEAIDYAEKIARSLAHYSSNNTWALYLFSYDNTSYRYLEESGEVVKSTTPFPDPIG